MKTLQLVRGAASLAVASLLFSALGMPASAASGADSAVSAISDASANIEAATGSSPLVEAVSSQGTSTQIVASTDVGDVTIQRDVASVALPTMVETPSVAVSLLGTTGSQVSSTGYAVFDIGTDASTVVLPKIDGSVQLLNVIESATAPTTYSYNLHLATGYFPVVDGDSGMITFMNSAREFAGGIAPAWAVDANGDRVPTSFSMDGTVLVQTIEHRASGVDYPVTSDPYLGKRLFQYVTLNTARTAVALKLTTWGRTVYVGGDLRIMTPLPVRILRGQVILNTYGLKEMLQRIPARYRSDFQTSSIRQQYECHALGWWADVSGQIWNLERSRPAMTIHWSNRVLTHRCNWNFSDGRV